MMFDEPTSALDPEMIGEVLNVIEDLAKENIVFLNHATRVARRYTAPLEKKVEASKHPL